MTKYALELMGGTYTGSTKPAKVRAKLVHGRGAYGISAGKAGLQGSVLEETTDRLIFHVPGGGIFSFPRNEIDLEILPAK